MTNINIPILKCASFSPPDKMFKAATRGVFNWTATYRTDSTVVAPYERWQVCISTIQYVKAEVARLIFLNLRRNTLLV